MGWKVQPFSHGSLQVICSALWKAPPQCFSSFRSSPWVHCASCKAHPAMCQATCHLWTRALAIQCHCKACCSLNAFHSYWSCATRNSQLLLRTAEATSRSGRLHLCAVNRCITNIALTSISSPSMMVMSFRSRVSRVVRCWRQAKVEVSLHSSIILPRVEMMKCLRVVISGTIGIPQRSRRSSLRCPACGHAHTL